MRKWLLILTFPAIIGLLMTGCATSGSNQIQASLAKEFTLPAGLTAQITGENLSLQLVAVIGDSRCPLGVQCIQAGDAKCTVRFTYNGADEQVTLTDTSGTNGFTQASYKQYKLNFRVEPYPQAGKTIAASDYRLRLTVTK